MLVVFDTNIWIFDRALTSQVDSAVRFYLREGKARIGLPEVIQLETESRVCATLRKKPALLYVTFTIEIPCSDDATTEQRAGARIEARGEGMHDADAGRFVDLASRGEKLISCLADGTRRELENIVIAVGNIVLGHRTVEHSVRYGL